MSSLSTQIKTNMTDSLKKGESVVVGALRFVLSEIQKEAINKYGVDADTKLTDDDVIRVLRKSVKSRSESLHIYTEAGRSELAKHEAQEIEILSKYLPAEIDDTELKKILAPLIESEGNDFGKIMKAAKIRFGTSVDGSRISTIVKQMLNPS